MHCPFPEASKVAALGRVEDLVKPVSPVIERDAYVYYIRHYIRTVNCLEEKKKQQPPKHRNFTKDP